MRPILVVNLDEVIKALLLLQEVEGGRFGGFLFQGQMHALVPAVLLRVAGLDALEADAESEPPDTEPGESEQSIAGGEGRAVVSPDRTRQPVVLEDTLEDRERELGSNRLETLAREQIPGPIIGDRERVTVALVAEHELALEVGAPQPIDVVSARELRSTGLVSSAFAAFDQAMAIEDGVDRARGRGVDHWEGPDDLVPDLRCTISMAGWLRESGPMN